MSKFTMAGTFNCIEGKNDEMDAALNAQVTAVADLEGVEVYTYLRGEGSAYGYFAVFSDRQAMMAASQTEAMKAAMAAFGGLLDGKPQMVMGAGLSAKGIEV